MVIYRKLRVAFPIIIAQPGCVVCISDSAWFPVVKGWMAFHHNCVCNYSEMIRTHGAVWKDVPCKLMRCLPCIHRTLHTSNEVFLFCLIPHYEGQLDVVYIDRGGDLTLCEVGRYCGEFVFVHHYIDITLHDTKYITWHVHKSKTPFIVLFKVDITRHSVIMHCFAHIFVTVVDLSTRLLMVKSIV